MFVKALSVMSIVITNLLKNTIAYTLQHNPEALIGKFRYMMTSLPIVNVKYTQDLFSNMYDLHVYLFALP